MPVRNSSMIAIARRRLHDAHEQRSRPAGEVADRERDRQPDEHRDPEHPAAGTLAQRGDRRGHDRDAHRDAERDDVLARASRRDPTEPVHGRARGERALRRRSDDGTREATADVQRRRAPHRGAGRRPRRWRARRARRRAARRRPSPRRATRRSSGSGPRRSTTRITSGRRGPSYSRTITTPVRAVAGQCTDADRVAVEVLAHAAGELGAAGREVGELRRRLRVADDDRTPGGLAPGRDVDRGGQRDARSVAASGPGRAARR